MPPQPATPKKKLSTTQIILISVCSAVALLLIIVLPIVFGVGKTKVDMNDYMTVNFDGANGYGSYTTRVEYDLLDPMVEHKDLMKYCKKLAKNEEYSWVPYAVEDWTDFFDIEMTSYQENGKLYNGDFLIFEIVLDEDIENSDLTVKDVAKGLGIKFKSTEIQVEVEGLPEAEVIDWATDIEQYLRYFNDDDSDLPPMDGETGVKIEFPKDFSKQVGDLYIVRGSNANEWNLVKDNKRFGNIKFSVNYPENQYRELSAGNEFTITPSVYADLENTNYIVPSAPKKITVPKLAGYVSTREAITDEVLKEFEAEIFESVANNYSAMENARIEKLYVAKRKPSSTVRYPYRVQAVLAYDYVSFFGDTEVQYRSFTGTLIENADGTIFMDLSSTYDRDSVEELQEDFFDMDNFEYEEVSIG